MSNAGDMVVNLIVTSPEFLSFGDLCSCGDQGQGRRDATAAAPPQRRRGESEQPVSSQIKASLGTTIIP